MKEKVVGGLIGGGILAGMGGVVWCMWWITKTFSYVLFYESMVKDTVINVLQTQGLL